MPKDTDKIKLAETILGKSRKPRKPYRTSNLFGLPLKTTTKEGKRQYMKLYMEEQRRKERQQKQRRRKRY